MAPKGSCEDGEHCKDHIPAEIERAALRETVKALCEQIAKHVESNQELLPKLYEMMAEVKQSRVDHERLRTELDNCRKDLEPRVKKLEMQMVKIFTAATVGGMLGGAVAQPIFKALAAAIGVGG
ncbi:MAG TPA: hypothetical protein PKM88_05600 [bacterium]|nr:hypothetical protein [bacterium]